MSVPARKDYLIKQINEAIAYNYYEHSMREDMFQYLVNEASGIGSSLARRLSILTIGQSLARTKMALTSPYLYNRAKVPYAATRNARHVMQFYKMPSFMEWKFNNDLLDTESGIRLIDFRINIELSGPRFIAKYNVSPSIKMSAIQHLTASLSAVKDVISVRFDSETDVHDVTTMGYHGLIPRTIKGITHTTLTVEGFF